MSIRNLLAVSALIVVVAVPAWLYSAKSTKDEKTSATPHAVTPAKVDKVVDEAILNKVELTPEAAKRLGIELAPVKKRPVQRFRSYGAELVLPTGAAVIVSAPLAGTLQNGESGKFPQVGQRIKAGETLLSVMPLLTPEREVLTPAERLRFAEVKATVAQTQIDADGQLQQASVQVDAARIALERAERLLRDNVGTRRAVDDAKAQLELAEKTLSAAKERKQLVDNISLNEKAGKLEPLPIKAPIEGVLRSTSVQTGQIVAANSPLFEVMNDSVLWVKVPVYVGELDDIDAKKPAQLTLLNNRKSGSDESVPPVSLPPTAAPLSSTVDVYYELANPEQRYRPGQRLAAQLPLNESAEVLSVPWSAIYYDIYGGQWVYTQVDNLSFARQRVEVGWVQDGWAALLKGPNADTTVVTAGVAELAGTEFGFAK